MARTVLRRLSLDDVNDAIVVLDRQIEEVRQLVNKVRSGALPFTGNIDLGGNRLTNLSSADTDNDALTLGELVDRLDDLEAEAAVLETTAAEDYSGGGRQKRLRQRTSRLKDMVEDAANNLISALGFPAVVFTQDDGAGNAELATDTANFVWDDTNNRLGLGTSTPSERLHVSGGNVRIDTLTLGSVLFADTGGVISQDNANFFWDDTNNRLGLLTATPTNTLDVGTGGTVRIRDFTAGSVVFAGTSGVLSQDNANLFWDDTNNRLGVGTATPAVRLHVVEGTTDIVAAFSGANEHFAVGQTEVTVNESGLSTLNFRAEGDTLTHLLFVDASADRVSIGDSTPDNFFTVGTTSQFQVGTDGDLDRIKDVPYSWPAANTAGYLRNDGAGALSWDASGAGIDHGGLGGLADDDHTQYLLLAGRAGTANNALLSTTVSGVLTGSSTISGNDTALKIRATTSVQATTIEFSDNMTTVSGNRAILAFGPVSALVFDTTNSILDFFRVGDSPTTISGVWQFNDNLSGGGGNIMRFRPTIRPGNGSKNNAGTWAVMMNQAVINSAGANQLTGFNGDMIGMYHIPSYTTTAGGVVEFGRDTALMSFLTAISTGATLAFRRAVWHRPPTTTTGTLQNCIVIDIEDEMATTTLRLAYRSVGTSMDFQHAGRAMFGATGAPDTTNGNVVEIERTHTLTANIDDGQAAGLVLDPGYTGAFTATRHNYIKLENASLAGGAAITDGCALWFDAAAGTHTAVDAHAGGGTPTLGAASAPVTGDPDAWVKINVNGTIMRIPAWA